MENALTVTSNGLENVSHAQCGSRGSIVMNRQSAISLRNLLIQSLGTILCLPVIHEITVIKTHHISYDLTLHMGKSIISVAMIIS